jgi:hypothetical protein
MEVRCNARLSMTAAIDGVFVRPVPAKEVIVA